MFHLIFCLFASAFLTSLIKFALWNLGKTWEVKYFLQTKGGDTGMCMYVPRKALQCPDETRKRSGEKRAKEGKQKESGE